MIQRYLGNKNSIIEPILEEVRSVCNYGDWVCDIFSGTLSVSMALKRNGYRVISNDINKFSYSFGISFLKNNSIPVFNLKSLKVDESKYSIGINNTSLDLKSKEGFSFLNKKKAPFCLQKVRDAYKLFESSHSFRITKGIPKIFFLRYIHTRRKEQLF